MLGLLVSSVPVPLPQSRSCWSYWVDYILKQRASLGMRQAALLSVTSGAVLASSSWRLSASDIANCQEKVSLSASHDSLTFDEKTYIIKSQQDGQVVAFNGRSYLIITRSKTMYIVVLCQCKAKKSAQAAAWLRQLRDTLVGKNF